MNQALINPSSYPNCIRYDEIDFTKGCEVGCLYCGLAKSKEKISHFEIETILSNIDTVNKGVYFSPNSDAFSSLAVEKTHKVLHEVLKRGKKVLINTKCVIPDKTIELLANYTEKCTIQVTVGRLDQDITNFLEPHSSLIEDRLKNIQAMCNKGIYVNGLIMPLFPGIDDDPEKLIELVNKLADTGLKCIKAAYVILKFGDDEKSLRMINQIKSNPLFESSLRLMTEHIKAHIGEGNIVDIKTRIETYRFIKDLCDSKNIKFLACSVLDPVLMDKNEVPCRICRNVLHYRK